MTTAAVLNLHLHRLAIRTLTRALRVLTRATHRGDRLVVALYNRLVDLEDRP